MLRPFDPIEQLPDVVEVQPWFGGAEIAGVDDEGRPLLWSGRGGQAPPQGVVDHVLERTPAAPGLRPQLCRDVFVERQCRAHIMMLVN